MQINHVEKSIRVENSVKICYISHRPRHNTRDSHIESKHWEPSVSNNEMRVDYLIDALMLRSITCKDYNLSGKALKILINLYWIASEDTQLTYA